ncbi:MAG: dienelactone hydrolase family protein [Planctomycetota bacterium]
MPRFCKRSTFLPGSALALLFGVMMMASPTQAQPEEIMTGSLAYDDQGVTLSAYIARPEEVAGPTPGVLIAHAWWGQGEYARHRARQLAELGYIAVVLDMYGQGVYTDSPEVAGQLAGAFYQDRDLFRARATAGLDMLKQQPNVDLDRLAAIGYCFGGTTVLELAYSGADLAGVVSFHGSLMGPRDDSDDAANINAAVLIAHGQADPLYSNEDLLGVIDALQAAEQDVTTVFYSGAVHAFTDPGASGEIPGVQYDRRADVRSWEHMKLFFDEIFARE